MIATASLFFYTNLIPIKTKINYTGVAIFREYSRVTVFHFHFTFQFAFATTLVFFKMDKELIHVELFGIAYGNEILFILNIIATEFIFSAAGYLSG